MKIKYLFMFIILLYGCTTSSNVEPPPTNLPLPTVNPEQELLVTNIKALFSASPHASEFSCEKCHTTKEGAVAKQLAWTDGSTGQMEVISSPNILCGKCHADQVIRSGSLDTTQLAHVDFECTNCHNAHNLQASCTESTCHTSIQYFLSLRIEKPANHTGLGDPDSYMCGGTLCHDLFKQVVNTPVYHQPLHRNVPCYVCHDVSGMVVIMDGEQSWITALDPGQGNGTEQPQVSHTIGLEVQCSKCHYTNNAWALNEILPDN